MRIQGGDIGDIPSNFLFFRQQQPIFFIFPLQPNSGSATDYNRPLMTFNLELY